MFEKVGCFAVAVWGVEGSWAGLMVSQRDLGLRHWFEVLDGLFFICQLFVQCVF